MTRLVYPTDVPRGARIVEHDLIVAGVAMWRGSGPDGVEGPMVAICDASMRTILLDPAERVEVDEDTPERRARLDAARAILRAAAAPLDEAGASGTPNAPDAASWTNAPAASSGDRR